MTLLLRPATPHDVEAISHLLGGRMVLPGERVSVLIDIGASDGAVVRAAAVVREAGAEWLVAAAAIDGRWPPVVDELLHQLRAAAIAGGADALVFRAGCSRELLAQVLGQAVVGAGGAVTLML